MVKDQREKEKLIPIHTGKGAGKGGDKKLIIGVPSNCAAEAKFFLTALLVLCSIGTLINFFPFALLHSCLTKDTTTVILVENNTAPSPSLATVPLPVEVQLENKQEDGVVKRNFNPVGTGAYNFILMSAYRGGPSTFSINGLASKPLVKFGNPVYTCEYQSSNNETISVTGSRILPDWDYGQVYTNVVITCNFPVGTTSVEDPTLGGKLLLHAAVNGGFDTEFNMIDTMMALEEPAESWNRTQFDVSIPPKYDYLYCGSPLYGTLSPQRVREWIAYHVRFFGKRSHFVIYDAGGVQPEVREVLRPWEELGYVTLQDIREQERFDGYYHNQFLVVNDCLHRHKFDTKWMFFFDVDEYIYLPKKSSLQSVMSELEGFTQFSFEQSPISSQLCLTDDAHKTHNKWGFEKLVYRNVKRERRDRKYAIQPRNVAATGVHLSQNYKGRNTHDTYNLMKYFHYHGTIGERREPCRRLVNETYVNDGGYPFKLDTTMRSVAPLVKRFELDTIGNRLQSTRQ